MFGDMPPFAHRFTLETDAPASTVWQLLEDVDGWPRWNAGTTFSTLDGPMRRGARGRMRLPDDEELGFEIVGFEPGSHFVDETPVGPVRVRVEHAVRDLGQGRARIVYAVEADGPPEAAQEIGHAVSADFPEVMDSLAELARRGG